MGIWGLNAGLRSAYGGIARRMVALAMLLGLTLVAVGAPAAMAADISPSSASGNTILYSDGAEVSNTDDQVHNLSYTVTGTNQITITYQWLPAYTGSYTHNYGIHTKLFYHNGSVWSEIFSNRVTAANLSGKFNIWQSETYVFDLPAPTSGVKYIRASIIDLAGSSDSLNQTQGCGTCGTTYAAGRHYDNADVSFTVTADTTPPVVTVPADIVVDTDPGENFATVTYAAPTATDNVGVTSGPTLIEGLASGSQFPLGVTTVKYEASDADGNTGTESFKVTVNDNEMPVFDSFPADMAIEVDYPDTSGTASWTEPTATDNVPGVSVVQTAGPSSGSSFPLGPTTVTYAATDVAGNVTTRSFTVTVTQIPPGSVELVVVSGEDGTFGFSSPEPVLNTNVTTSSGAGTSGAIFIRPGTYAVSFSVPSGFGVTGATCSDGVSTFDTTLQSGSVVLVSGASVTCTISTVNSLGETVGMIGAMMEARSQMILQSQPERERRIERLKGNYTNNGGIYGPGLAYVSPDLPIAAHLAEGSFSFSYSLRRSQAEAAGDGSTRYEGLTVGGIPMGVSAEGTDTARPNAINAFAATETGSGKPGAASMLEGLGGNKAARSSETLQHRFDIWAEGTLARFDAAGGEGYFGIFHGGADYLVTPDILLGISVQVDVIDMEFAGSAGAYGVGFMVGPYATIRLANQFYFDGRAAWGRSYNDISPFGTYTDSFGAERWLVTGALIGDFDVADLNVRPELRLSYFRERSESYVDSLAVTIPSVSVATGTLEFGPTISKSFELDNEMAFKPFATFKGIWTFLQENTATAVSGQPGIANESLRGRVEAGFDLSGNGGLTFSLSGFVDGIGETGYEAWGGTLRVNKPL